MIIDIEDEDWVKLSRETNKQQSKNQIIKGIEDISKIFNYGGAKACLPTERAEGVMAESTEPAASRCLALAVFLSWAHPSVIIAITIAQIFRKTVQLSLV